MPDKPVDQDLAHGVPPIAVSTTSTLANRTGSWKYIQPIYQDRIAPCNAACPVGIDIEGCMDLLRQGRVAEARELMLRENPMPAVTGRICEHPCHAACSRGAFDEAVNIRAVERMLGEREAATGAVGPARETAGMSHPRAAAAPGGSAPKRKEKVAIVGSGPAGLACAYHLARLGYTTTVFESDPEPGGRLRYGIPEHKLPRAVLAREIDRIRSAGVVIRCNARLGGNLAWETVERHDAVFVATGARDPEPPRAWERHDIPAVRPGLDFLRDVRAGEPAAIGRRVVVIGGTEAAVDCARTALRLGSEVTMLFDGAREELEADLETLDAACREGLKIEYQARPVGLQLAGHPEDEPALEAIESMFDGGGADQPRTLVGVACVRVRPPAPGEGAASARLTAPGSAFVVPADTVLTALGAEHGCEFLPPDVHRRGFTIRCDEWGRTGKAGLFAGGDVAGAPRTVAHALGAGKRVAIAIDHWLRERAREKPSAPDLPALRYGETGNVSITRWRGDDPMRRVNELNQVVPREMLNFAYFKHEPRHPDRWSAPGYGSSALAEVNLGLPEAEALAEAQRCFNCGVCNDCEVCLIVCPDVAIKRHAEHGFSLSYKYCKGCGLCVQECPRGAMTMTREGL